MSKTDNSHSIRLYESIKKHSNEQIAERIAHKIPLSKSADFKKKFAWAESICTDLQNEFDDETIKKIRLDCACGPEMGKIEKMKKVYQTSSDKNEFIEKVNQKGYGFTLEYANNRIFLIYLECCCSCVKRIDKPLPKEWCYCTLGYTKRMFEYVFSKTVNVELLESIKTGSKRCVISVDIC